MSNEEYVAMQRRRVVELARQILAGELDVLDGCSKIFGLQGEIGVEIQDDDFTPFVAVVSETDHLPIGEEASNWSAEALARLEPELRKARDWAMRTVRQPCKKLIARFGDA